MVTKLTLEYDGTAFAGWGRQPGMRTVQEEVERALWTVLGETGSDGRPLSLRVAGRTDRGVHAWGQVASYAHEAVDPARLNGLPERRVLWRKKSYSGIFIGDAATRHRKIVRTNLATNVVVLRVLHNVIAAIFHVLHQFVIITSHPVVRIERTNTGNHGIKLLQVYPVHVFLGQ